MMGKTLEFLNVAMISIETASSSGSCTRTRAQFAKPLVWQRKMILSSSWNYPELEFDLLCQHFAASSVWEHYLLGSFLCY